MIHQPGERVRVTISLDRELADQIDELVDGIRIRNRSHAIETLVTDSLELAQIRLAVIMAGGEGALERLPAIEDMLTTLGQQGISDIIVAVGYLGEEMRQELGNGERFGLNIQYTKSDLGTGGALLQLKNRLKKTFLVVNVDRPIKIDLKSLARFHQLHRPWITAATPSLRDFTGIYLIEPRVISHIPAGFCMLEDTVFEDVARQGKLLSYPLSS
jgi:NDP-sugar pyrophosphorylase family protein